MKKVIAISIAVASLSFLQNCASITGNDVVTKKIVIEHPPSLIYADDDSTLLGQFSNVGKSGPNRAPYFCESLKKELQLLFAKKDPLGKFIYRKTDGTPYDIYSDELRIYTTINPETQKHAETAMRKHLMDDLQPAFTENNRNVKHPPFSDTYHGRTVGKDEISKLLNLSRKASPRFQAMQTMGISENEILASFNTPVNMKLFSFDGEIDTLLSPNDSILYSLNFLRAGMISMEPSTGHVKAWVGGVDFDHFPSDNIRDRKRQIGTAIRPFLYATAMSMSVIKPCDQFKESDYCIEPCDPAGIKWCPTVSTISTVSNGFALSTGNNSAAVMSKMGTCSGPKTIAKLFSRLNINVPIELVTPAICLGTVDASLFELVGAHAMFVNNGVFIAPQTILRIEDRDGNVIYRTKSEPKEVINSIVAFEMIGMMKGLVEFGMATSLRGSAKWGGMNEPIAATVGTTQSNTDGWFIGMTPNLVTGVWVGGEDKRIRFRSMLWGQGARSALPIYGYFMQKMYADSNISMSKGNFIPPKNYDPTLFGCSPDHDHTKPAENPFGVR